MKKTWSMVAAGVALLVAVAAGWILVTRTQATPIAGLESALPRAQPEAEFILPAALDAAREEAVSRNVRALVVHRRGHRVFEQFTRGADGTTTLEGGELGALVLSLALHEPEQDAGQDRAVIARLVSERLWQPLRAGDASLSGTPGASRRCCIQARLDDWMRVGDLLLGTGAYLGERLVAADAVRAVLAGRQASWQGDEPLLARDGMTFDLQDGVRLWLAPRRQLAILVWGDAGAARDTLIPNIILRGLNDAAPAIGGGIEDIVPGH